MEVAGGAEVVVALAAAPQVLQHSSRTSASSQKGSSPAHSDWSTQSPGLGAASAPPAWGFGAGAAGAEGGASVPSQVLQQFSRTAALSQLAFNPAQLDALSVHASADGAGARQVLQQFSKMFAKWHMS